MFILQSDSYWEYQTLLWYSSFGNINSEIYITRNIKPFSPNFKHSAVAIFPLDVTSWAIISCLKTCCDTQRYIPIPTPRPHKTRGHHRKEILSSISLAYVTVKQAHKHKLFFAEIYCKCSIVVAAYFLDKNTDNGKSHRKVWRKFSHWKIKQQSVTKKKS